MMANSRKFKNIELPDNLRLIGYHAFAGCEFLHELRIPLSVTHLGFEATASCKAPVRCGAVPLTVENVLKQRVTTVEKNVYGFIRSLLLFSDLNDIKPIDVINKMGDKYIISIYYLGWGDINYQRRDNCMSDWHHIVFNESARYDVKETEDNAAREKAHVICNKIFEIKESTDKKYSEIIKEYFSEDNC